jgi:hypothetical protein
LSYFCWAFLDGRIVEDCCQLLRSVLSCDIVGVVSPVIRVFLLFVVAIVDFIVILIFFLVLVIVSVVLFLLSQVFSLLSIQPILIVLFNGFLLQERLRFLHGFESRLQLSSAIDGLVDGDLPVLALYVVVASQLGVEEVSEEDEFWMEKLCKHE